MFKFVAIAFWLISMVKCARILSVFATPSPSHVLLGYEVSEELARRGHEVVMVTPHPKQLKMDNFSQIALTDLAHAWDKEKSNYLDLYDMSAWKQTMYCYHMGYAIVESTYEDRQVKNLFKLNQTFDLVLLDHFYTEALLGIAHHFSAPVILFSALESSIWTHHMLKNPEFYSYMPNIFLGFSNSMNFAQRLSNTLLNLMDEAYKRFVAYPHHDKLLHQHLPLAPSLDELVQNISLIFVNAHASLGGAHAKVANLIDVGGMHVKPKNNLNEDVKNFLDNSPEGVVYFSLGSNLKPATMSKEKISAFLNAFTRLNVKILWKFDGELPEGKPQNLAIGRWFSQVDVLAHPNVKAFISHGGLLSTIEATHFGVPILGIPIYGDQFMNIERAVENGYALRINYHELNEETLLKNLEEILGNSTYKENAERRSAMLRDRPMDPLDTAVYWAEYVIRYKGAPHLRTAATKLNWFQIHLIDVIALLLFLTMAAIYAASLVVKSITRRKYKSD